jgi:hypothetical protein
MNKLEELIRNGYANGMLPLDEARLMATAEGRLELAQRRALAEQTAQIAAENARLSSLLEQQKADADAQIRRLQYEADRARSRQIDAEMAAIKAQLAVAERGATTEQEAAA